jgi:hypothetical protein
MADLSVGTEHKELARVALDPLCGAVNVGSEPSPEALGLCFVPVLRGYEFRPRGLGEDNRLP